jgi:hypothetical protein
VPSPSAHPVADVLADLRRALDGAGLRWFLFGAQAAILHGVVRLSADVDITVDLGTRPAHALVEVLTRGGFDHLVPDAGFIEATRVMPFVHRVSRMPVDVVLAGPGLEEQFLARAEIRRVGEIAIPVVSAEDLITMKILAGRARDLDDVAAVVRARRHELDLGQTRATLRLLEGALDRADLVIELERILRATDGPAWPGA